MATADRQRTANRLKYNKRQQAGNAARARANTPTIRPLQPGTRVVPSAGPSRRETPIQTINRVGGRIFDNVAESIIPRSTIEKVRTGKGLDAGEALGLAALLPVPGLGPAMKGLQAGSKAVTGAGKAAATSTGKATGRKPLTQTVGDAVGPEKAAAAKKVAAPASKPKKPSTAKAPKSKPTMPVRGNYASDASFNRAMNNYLKRAQAWNKANPKNKAKLPSEPKARPGLGKTRREVETDVRKSESTRTPAEKETIRRGKKNDEPVKADDAQRSVTESESMADFRARTNAPRPDDAVDDVSKVIKPDEVKAFVDRRAKGRGKTGPGRSKPAQARKDLEETLGKQLARARAAREADEAVEAGLRAKPTTAAGRKQRAANNKKSRENRQRYGDRIEERRNRNIGRRTGTEQRRRTAAEARRSREKDLKNPKTKEEKGLQAKNEREMTREAERTSVFGSLMRPGRMVRDVNKSRPRIQPDTRKGPDQVAMSPQGVRATAPKGGADLKPRSVMDRIAARVREANPGLRLRARTGPAPKPKERKLPDRSRLAALKPAKKETAPAAAKKPSAKSKKESAESPVESTPTPTAPKTPKKEVTGAKKPSAKKTPAKKSEPKETPAAKPEAVKKPAAKKAAAEKAPAAKKSSVKKPSAKKKTAAAGAEAGARGTASSKAQAGKQAKPPRKKWSKKKKVAVGAVATTGGVMLAGGILGRMGRNDRTPTPPTQDSANTGTDKPAKNYVRDKFGRKMSRAELARRKAWRSKKTKLNAAQREKQWKKELKRRQRYRSNLGKKAFGDEAVKKTQAGNYFRNKKGEKVFYKSDIGAKQKKALRQKAFGGS